MSAILTPLPAEMAALESVAVDVYRDIHKGLRHELFGVTLAAGSVDAGDRAAVADVVARYRELVRILDAHAEHEDTYIGPLLRAHAPDLAEVIDTVHPALEATLASLDLLADRAVDAARSERRLAVHRWYLGVASFTAEYLRHQEFEELEVMTALSAAMPADEIAATHHALVSSIPPDEMAAALRIMLPAMNLDDRAELLGGMQAGAPAAAFSAVLGLAASVLTPADYRALTTRLDVS